MSYRTTFLVALIAFLLSIMGASSLRANEPVAHGILFFSPTCPHCHVVIDDVLPPLEARYGAQLAIMIIDVSQPDGQAIYRAAVERFNVPQERLGVPALIFGEQFLVGSAEIPQLLPGMIAETLAAGGNAWPAIPGFTPPALDQPMPTPQALSPFQRDPVGNGAAVVMLAIMLISVFVLARFMRGPFDQPLAPWRVKAVPILTLIGMVVATYLAYIEISGAEAVCGPVGDCNTVQQSEYAKIFGIPVGLIGLAGYTVILLAWAIRQYGSGRSAHWAAIALPTIVFGGVLFSSYLTFLEPFVIGATCAWCLASAAIMTALLWVTVPQNKAPATRGRRRTDQGRKLAH
ncbi:vitamin K epoxide reductase family protein [Candidatus Viridilinea mediisalina]|uniref:Vitamin K epoxide reductase n=1 Tax=Candidatus Viridilinea mediisalina TaxID=2024553 RepID=A0A2A6RKB4_9CHLR|nr:vitamin K epoxide reductase family protein [Candidatus Viridilinea mediisalina]PDW03308.1 vitamin K epoxide reductase [Candidatus Viridilinea mediisalina]